MTPPPADGASTNAPSERWHLLLILAFAAAAMAPELVGGISVSDSMRYNIVWTDQFRELFAAGDLYPRWLPRSWDGLGSPTFYFYPPLFFWAASLLDTLSLGILPTGLLVSLTSAFVLAASGVAMRLWLSLHADSKAATFGAIAYMLAPYHLYDIYGRGALAEASGYALLPLVMLSLRRIAEGSLPSPLLLAASYGALVMTHLPTALLVTVFVIPAYALFEGRRAPSGLSSFASRALAGGLLGLGLASAYLLPALSLTAHISSDALFGSYYDPANWFFLHPESWPKRGPMLLIVPVSAATLLLAAAGAWAGRHGARRAEAFFWCGVAIFCFLMISGLLPFLWKLPYLAQVQFPWRLLVIAEFAAITAVVAGRPAIRMPLAFLGALPAAAAATVAFTMIGYSTSKAVAESAAKTAELRADHRDAPEYLPRGAPIVLNEEGAPDAERIPLPSRPPVTATSGEARLTSTSIAGAMRVEVESPTATEIVVRRFYFPHWQVLDQSGRAVSARSSQDRLLSWRAPAGRHAFTISSGEAPGDRLARGLSLATLLLLGFGLLLLRLGKSRQ